MRQRCFCGRCKVCRQRTTHRRKTGAKSACWARSVRAYVRAALGYPPCSLCLPLQSGRIRLSA